MGRSFGGTPRARGMSPDLTPPSSSPANALREPGASSFICSWPGKLARCSARNQSPFRDSGAGDARPCPATAASEGCVPRSCGGQGQPLEENPLPPRARRVAVGRESVGELRSSWPPAPHCWTLHRGTIRSCLQVSARLSASSSLATLCRSCWPTRRTSARRAPCRPDRPCMRYFGRTLWSMLTASRRLLLQRVDCVT